MFPPTLIRAIRQGRCVPFVGAGVSRSVTYSDRADALFPTWSDLLRDLAEAARRSGDEAKSRELDRTLAAKNPDLAAAAGVAFEALGPDLWKQQLRSLFAKSQNLANDESLALPRAVWRLGSSRVVTTNYENVLAWAEPNALVCTSRQRTEVGEFIRGEDSQPRVWHLHGHIAQLDSLVVTRKNYEQLYTVGEGREQRGFEPGRIALPMLMARDRLLMIGYGLGDAEIVGYLRSLTEVFGLGAGEHFALVSESARASFAAYEDFLHVIEYSQNGAPLLQCLSELGLVAGAVPDRQPMSLQIQFASQTLSAFARTILSS
jgi:hypothetical protein